jgi:hypothetical protein
MKWRKLGRIFEVGLSEMRSSTHAQLPTPCVLGDVVRVYFSARQGGRAYPAFFDLSTHDLTRVARFQERVALPYGVPGTFDHDGIMPNHVIRVGEEVWMYYSGWSRLLSVPYAINSGLAISTDGGRTFVKHGLGPILDRSPVDPYMAMTPWVMPGHQVWRMLYVSGTAWKSASTGLEPVYTIRQAVSRDGVRWDRDGGDVVPQWHPDESHAHPTVAVVDGVHHMWYSVRQHDHFRDGEGSYRMGYSRSADGKIWTRADDDCTIHPSNEGWDSKMLCYPYVIEVRGQYYMFYNGNSFGQSGIGLAILE